MKAFLLAAGLGTRLRPYTDTIPKCLMPICGRPLLGIWLDHLKAHGITEVLINTHHLADKVSDFIASENFGNLKIYLVHEDNLLGSAGTVLNNRSFISDDSPFIIIYADNLTNVDLTGLVDFHKKISLKGAVFTMGLIRAPEPKRCGIVTINNDMLITDFTEKPENPASDLANCGIYVTDRRVFDFFPDSMPDSGILDFGFDIIPFLKGKMYGHHVNGYLRDIGTLESYRLACDEWISIMEENSKTEGSRK
ncbi:nucleotidyltransferase family protein [Desulforegula conservatrix]|uniref:nucleotidyltransferase family protein n=1 Tax=Desulforegula conservatrix TaxID=153026 RepID=UPI0003F7CDA0|nr:nucleotidyltransferase family protein [Desulforegula conservatrix]